MEHKAIIQPMTKKSGRNHHNGMQTNTSSIGQLTPKSNKRNKKNLLLLVSWAYSSAIQGKISCDRNLKWSMLLVLVCIV